MRQPVGPCLLITPWSVPLAMGTRKIGSAIATGCTMVLKPAPQTPLSSLALAGILAEAGLPAGARLVDVGRGALVDEEALGRHLADGRLAGAALDVFGQEPLPAASPLWDLPGVIVSPHTAGEVTAGGPTSRTCSWTT
jgi:hypothetical protein